MAKNHWELRAGAIWMQGRGKKLEKRLGARESCWVGHGSLPYPGLLASLMFTSLMYILTFINTVQPYKYRLMASCPFSQACPVPLRPEPPARGSAPGGAHEHAIGTPAPCAWHKWGNDIFLSGDELRGFVSDTR